MLYIRLTDGFTVKFHDNNGHGNNYGTNLQARSDGYGRIWISSVYEDEDGEDGFNVLNSCLVSGISLWVDTAYVVYATPAEFVSAFNTQVATGGFDSLAPSGLVLTEGETSIQLGWTINSQDAEGHSVERSTDGVTYAEIGTVTGATSTYTDSLTVEEVVYYYRVRAYKYSNYSDYCAVQQGSYLNWQYFDGIRYLVFTLETTIARKGVRNSAFVIDILRPESVWENISEIQ